MNKIKSKTRENILVFIFLTKIIQLFIVFRIFNSDHSIFTGIIRFHSQRLWRYTLLSITVPSTLLAFSGGDGTAGNPFQITTAKQLDSIRYYCNISDSGKHFKLMNDIDLTDWLGQSGPGYNEGEFWQPINNFYGNFNGSNHKIVGLKIIRPYYDSIGFFGSIRAGSKLQNVGVEIMPQDTVMGYQYVGGLVGFCDSGMVTNCYSTGMVTANRSNVGGLIGYCYGMVSNCYFTGIVEGREGATGGLIGTCKYYETVVTNCYTTGFAAGGNTVGGLIGWCDNHVKVSGCYATGRVSGGSSDVGGLIGNCEQGTDVSGCYATGKVSGNGNIGGLVGNCSSSWITNSYATGAVASSGDRIGGLVGNCEGAVSNSYATGEVRGTYRIGGLAGHCNNGRLLNCYATGTVSGVNRVGGLIGYFDYGTVTSCYAVGAVICDSIYSGGLVGNGGSGTVIDSYWDRETTGELHSPRSDLSFSKFTDQMKTQPTFVDWDFDTTWAIESEKNNGYPYLQWQFKTGTKNVRGGNNRSVNRISLYIQNRTIIFPSSLPAYTTFSVLDLNGRVIYKTFVQGASVKLPQIGHRMVLWQVKQSNGITTGSIMIK